MSRFRPWLAPLIALGFALLLFAGYKGLRLWQVHTLFEPENIVENFRTMSQLFDALPVQRSGPQRPLEEQPRELPASFNFQGNAIVLNDWIKQTGTTGLLVLADDRIAFEHYYQGNDVHTRAIGWSVSKSFMSLLIGVALEDGAIHDLLDPVTRYAPQLKGSGYEGVPLRDVLEMSSGIAFNEDYADPDADINRLGRTLALGGSVDAWVSGLKRDSPPGQQHHYISVDTQVLSMVLKGATGKSPSQYMSEKLWSRLGAECDGLWLTDGTGTELAFGGVNLCLRDFARLGLLYLHQGRSQSGEAIVSPNWVQASTHPRDAHLQPGRTQEEGEPNLGYGYQWWIPKSNEGEFMAIGVYGQFVYVNPKRRVVIAKSSAYANYNVDGIRMEHESLAAFRTIAHQLKP
ncbi:serine hydrolase [Pseudomonas nicosulfuronedens]|uniref:Serine hydrolase n=1 Tax=Pseudomonas nicosulfuronedens TaxID=2571105 RepID=A0A5R9QMG2_9PSED|nr:serine hydrolase [Pseudomonas nicosulfuronedens]TLX70036.1 serine hydrolase [Pseudomonas nicosulfuronedens]